MNNLLYCIGAAMAEGVESSACRSVLEQDAESGIVPHRTTKCC